MHWIEPEPVSPGSPPFADDPLLDAILRRRVAGATEAAEFLDARQRPAPDPLRLPGMEAAARRVAMALADREPIAIFGDYDVDGISATALLALALGSASPLAPATYLPTRADGYGLNPEAVRRIAAAGVRLLIAVDCGSGDHEPVAVARSLGLDVVVLDHHRMEGRGPDGAIVASAQLEPDGAYRELSAAGVAYLLATALVRAGFDLGRGSEREPRHLLDLAALGTIADVSPLSGVNRPLVRDGLRWLRERPRVGINALAEAARLSVPSLSSADVGFKLAPRLNAAGRMADPALALDLLLTEDAAVAARLVAELEGLNLKRRIEAERIVAEAEATLRREAGLERRRVLVVAGPGWGSGVLGLAATRLADRFRRPVVLLSDDGATSRGSARSVPGFDIATALAACDHLLEGYGGHAQAAGVTLPSSLVDRLESELSDLVVEAGLPPAGEPALRIDAELPLDRIDLATVDRLACLEPLGHGNEPPVLLARDTRLVSYQAFGQSSQHLRFRLRTPRGEVEAIAWGAAGRSRELVGRRTVDLVGNLTANDWNGRRRARIEVKDFRAC